MAVVGAEMRAKEGVNGGDGALISGVTPTVRERTRIYVGGLGESVTEDDLRKTFSTLEEIESVDIVRTKGRSFAYLDFLPSLEKSLPKLFSTIYAWIGCNSAKFGSLYAAAPTRPSNTVSVTSLLGGASDKTGYSIAHRIVIRTGLNVALACNIPKDNPMLEVAAQKKLVEKLIALGVTKPKS